MPGVCRIGDSDVAHCTPTKRAQGAVGIIDTEPREYQGKSATTLVGFGSGLIVSITKTGTSYTSATVEDGGSGFIRDETLLVRGTELGGLSPVNDAVITITGATPIIPATPFSEQSGGEASLVSVTGVAKQRFIRGVYCNGRAISRQGDLNEPHHAPPHKDVHPNCGIHVAPITTGSTTVFVNGRGCGRIGDRITNCTSVAEGSTNVFAGG